MTRTRSRPNGTNIGMGYDRVVVVDYDPDGNAVVANSRFGRRRTISRLYQPAKGLPPRIGESWLISKEAGVWAFHSYIAPSNHADYTDRLTLAPPGVVLWDTFIGHPPGEPLVGRTLPTGQEWTGDSEMTVAWGAMRSTLSGTSEVSASLTRPLDRIEVEGYFRPANEGGGGSISVQVDEAKLVVSPDSWEFYELGVLVDGAACTIEAGMDLRHRLGMQRTSDGLMLTGPGFTVEVPLAADSWLGEAISIGLERVPDENEPMVTSVTAWTAHPATPAPGEWASVSPTISDMFGGTIGLGDGSIEMRYVQQGSIASGSIIISVGDSPSVGSGPWAIFEADLPFTPKLPPSSRAYPSGFGFVSNITDSAFACPTIAGLGPAGASMIFATAIGDSAPGLGTLLSGSNPLPLASGTILQGGFTCEVDV